MDEPNNSNSNSMFGTATIHLSSGFLVNFKPNVKRWESETFVGSEEQLADFFFWLFSGISQTVCTVIDNGLNN